ncbi:[citrate (pro-3S)-lyase] ligase [Lactococcus lactis]|uniref:[citrate (pro-3S)-lyase] ligase n=1 Tax=Lactococcus lactis TaxID=1358 RepID=UPI001D184853|nr:[citrate (pro-3S)-lyase] ligase [Lactococcus lactis]MCC4119322.1 [citrate (pro-3S)-lyase] ligase [Lactococcus lactis]
MEKVEDLFLKMLIHRKEWDKFLTGLHLNVSNSSEIETIDETVAIFAKNGEVLATGSIAGNVIKYVATCTNGEQSAGERFNKIITELMNRLAEKGIYHVFVFTKPMYAKSFGYLGFKELARAEQGVLLEKGRPNITDFLSSLTEKKLVPAGAKKIAAVVMNANPFTLGHCYLVEQAAAENDFVYVFVVSTDRSLFRADERLDLVKKGLSALTNVSVVSGGDYLVSFATFPAYFIQSDEEVMDFQTQIDARIFKNWFVEALGITARYLGAEPFSKTTSIYNQQLTEVLSDVIDVKIIERKKADDNEEIISATAVRAAIATNQLEKIRKFVPETTFEFIEQHLQELQARIKGGQKTNGN